MFSLNISGEDADLTEGTKIQLNRKLFDLKDITARGLVFTNAFTLPYTVKNDRLTGHPSRLASNNMAFEENRPFTLLHNNSIVSSGTVMINSFDSKKGIKVQLVSAGGFWALAGAKKLTDLNNRRDDYVFQEGALDLRIGDSVFSNAGACYEVQGIDSRTSRPAICFKAVLDRVFEDLKYIVDYGNIEFSGSLAYNNNIIINLLYLGCLSNHTDFFVTDYKAHIRNKTAVTQGSFNEIFVKPGGLKFNSYEIGHWDYDISHSFLNVRYAIKGWARKIEDNEESSIVVHAHKQKSIVLTDTIVQNGTFFLNVITGLFDQGTGVRFAVTNLLILDAYFFTVISESDIFKFQKGENERKEKEASDALAAAKEEANTALGAEAKLEKIKKVFELSQPFEPEKINIDGYMVLGDYNLPGQTYKNFLKNLMALFFLELKVDEVAKTIKVVEVPETMEIKRRDNMDLSSVVYGENGHQTGGMYAANNDMGYARDNESNDNGSFTFSIKKGDSKSVKKFIEIKDYSMSAYASRSPLLHFPIYDLKNSNRQSIKNRIVIFVPPNGNYDIDRGVYLNSYLLDMSNIFNLSYRKFVEATKRERTVTFRAKLTVLQFHELQAKPVFYVNRFSSYFLAVEIKGFDGENPCTLKAIRYGG